MPFCRNCGKEIAPRATLCTACGVSPPKGDRFCQNCGAQVEPIAEVCVKCGVRLARSQALSQPSAKSKTTSVLLAVFLSYWTWLYTYKRDGWKFWLGLGLSLTNGLLVAATLGLWLIVGWLPWLGILVWAIVDVASKPSEWYQGY